VALALACAESVCSHGSWANLVKEQRGLGVVGWWGGRANHAAITLSPLDNPPRAAALMIHGGVHPVGVLENSAEPADSTSAGRSCRSLPGYLSGLLDIRAFLFARGVAPEERRGTQCHENRGNKPDRDPSVSVVLAHRNDDTALARPNCRTIRANSSKDHSLSQAG
jgi:hypothetical protein